MSKSEGSGGRATNTGSVLDMTRKHDNKARQIDVKQQICLLDSEGC